MCTLLFCYGAYTKMVETFLEIQDIAAEKRDVMRLKEAERDSRHSFRGIGEALIDLQKQPLN